MLNFDDFVAIIHVSVSHSAECSCAGIIKIQTAHFRINSVALIKLKLKGHFTVICAQRVGNFNLSFPEVGNLNQKCQFFTAEHTFYRLTMMSSLL